MLTPAFLNVKSYFYPIGNTPAVSLTQAMPQGVPTDVLLLGCGDLRNILFTRHVDGMKFYTLMRILRANFCRDRKMDITCCDNQKAVIGVLLPPTCLMDGDNTFLSS